jgi:hypothetical protein
MAKPSLFSSRKKVLKPLWAYNLLCYPRIGKVIRCNAF